MKSRYLILGLIIAICSIAAYYFMFSKSNSAIDSESQTTSDARSAQSGFNISELGEDDGGRQAGSTLREDKGSAGSSDTSGNIDQSIDTSNPYVSSTGEIALYSPKQNSLVTGGQITVAGTSKLNTVMYRISDNVSGLITTGSFKVVDSRFSGTINIDTNGSMGQLDIFGSHENGNEFSNISVPLNFK